MNEMIGNIPLSHSVIIAATRGDPEAMASILQHYEGNIACLSMRKMYNQFGNTYYGVDEDIRNRLQSKLIQAVLSFRE